VNPAELRAAILPVQRRLARGKELRIRDDHGTDVRLGLLKRPGAALWGTLSPADLARPFGMLMSLPSGLLRVPLDETVADGTVVSNRTSYYDSGAAHHPTFNFTDGKLVEATFDRNPEFFQTPYRAATKGKDRPGMLSIGFNPRLHDTPMVEDIERGAVMVSVGGNKFVGGRNPSDFFGWAVTAGATIEVDGVPLPLPG
jgi:leucyl aminopeptidase (aminopeptidase T)